MKLSYCFALGLKPDNDSSESSQSVIINEKAILPCPKFKEVIKVDGEYRFVKWSYWTSNGTNSSWKWFIGMNKQGETKAERDGFKISSDDGSLSINKVQPSDAGKYMCTVERTNYKSPKRHVVTLSINKNGKNCLIYALPFLYS